MSSTGFVKGECRHCAGHLEFPADAAGETVVCPHCGQTTQLAVAKPPYTRSPTGGKLAIIAVVLMAVAAGAGAWYVLRREHPVGNPETVSPPTNALAATPPATNAPAPVIATTPTPPPAPVQPEFPNAKARTNDFAVLDYQLQKTPGTSLIYVTGTVANTSERQRFGVKVVFNLFDPDAMPVGTASDYQSVLEAHGRWNFRALVIPSKAVSAEFNAIGEEQQ